MKMHKPPSQPGILRAFGSQPKVPSWASRAAVRETGGAGCPENYHPDSAHDLSAEASATRESEGAGEVWSGVGLEHLEGPARQGTVSVGLGMIRVPQVWEWRREKLQERDEDMRRVTHQDPGCCCCFLDQTKLASGRHCLAHLFSKCFCTSQLHPPRCPAEPRGLVASAQPPLRQGAGWCCPSCSGCCLQRCFCCF